MHVCLSSSTGRLILLVLLFSFERRPLPHSLPMLAELIARCTPKVYVTARLRRNFTKPFQQNGFMRLFEEVEDWYEEIVGTIARTAKRSPRRTEPASILSLSLSSLQPVVGGRRRVPEYLDLNLAVFRGIPGEAKSIALQAAWNGMNDVHCVFNYKHGINGAKGAKGGHSAVCSAGCAKGVTTVASSAPCVAARRTQACLVGGVTRWRW